jgi:hypothetical protein
MTSLSSQRPLRRSRILLRKRRLLAFAASEGYRRVHGGVLSENQKMLDLCRDLGFALKSDKAPGVTLTEIALPASRE